MCSAHAWPLSCLTGISLPNRLAPAQLWSYYVAPDVHAPELLVNEPVVFDAVRLMLDVWVTEQHHEERSRYRYSELPRDGRGPLVNYTGGQNGSGGLDRIALLTAYCGTQSRLLHTLNCLKCIAAPML